MGKEFLKYLEDDSKERVIADYIAGMSDNYCLDSFEKLTIPQPISFKG